VTDRAQWTVAYDFASQWFNAFDWIHVPFGLVWIFAGVLLIRGGEQRVGGVLLVVFGGAIIASLSIPLVQTHLQLWQAHDERTYEVAEGVVERVQTVCTSHGGESFDVNGVRFAYADGMVHPGFRHTACWGGPMRARLYVRIWYVDLSAARYIIRLEIRR
jgi:hypothetical protein